MDPGWFRAATRKERPYFAAECGPDPFGHTRALEGPFFDPEIQSPVYSSHTKRTALSCCRTWPRPPWAHMDPGSFRAATRKEQPCFAAECGLGRLGHTGTPDGLEQPHEKNGPVLLQNVAPTPLGTHEHSRVHFSILRFRTPFRAATRKERPCFAAECGPDPFGHTRALEGPFFARGVTGLRFRAWSYL